MDGVQGSGARLMARGMWMTWTWLGPGSVRMEARETDRSGSGFGCSRCRVKDEWMEQAKARELEAYLVQERKAKLELGGV